MDYWKHILMCSLLYLWCVLVFECREIYTAPDGIWNIANNFDLIGTFWIVQGTSNMPFYAVGTNYSPTGNSLEGIQTPEYNATVGLYYVILSVLTFVYLICSIRTNICLFSALFLLVITFALTAATFFQVALGNAENAARLQLVFIILV